MRHRIQRADAADRLYQKDKRGDEGNNIANLKLAVRHSPAGQRNNTANGNSTDNFEDRVNLRTPRQQPDKPRIETVKSMSCPPDLGILELIGLDHAGALQRFGQQRGHAFHMFLEIAGRLALACANADDRLHRKRIDSQHHQCHQPVEPDHRHNQHDHRQHITNKIIGKPHGGFADKVQVVHDPGHEGACRFARQHRQIGLDQRARHVLLQVRRHPERQRVDLHSLREQGHTLDQRQNNDGDRRHDDHLGGTTVGQCVEDIACQQRIGGCRGGDHRHQSKGQKQPAEIAAHPPRPDAAQDGAAVCGSRCRAGRQEGNPAEVRPFMWIFFACISAVTGRPCLFQVVFPACSMSRLQPKKPVPP